eukprot:gene37590-46371_t
MARRPSSAPMAMPASRPPAACGTCGSRGLMRTRRPPWCCSTLWLKWRTEGIAVPAPSSTTTGLRTRASHACMRASCAADIRPRQAAAVRAGGRRIAQPAGVRIHLRHEAIRAPDIGAGSATASAPAVAATGAHALQMVDGTVALQHPLRIESRQLELPVHIAGEDAGAREARVRRRGAVQRQPVAVKAPGQPRIGPERLRRGDTAEIQPRAAQRRIGLPETLVAAKIREAGIDAHAGAGMGVDS